MLRNLQKILTFDRNTGFGSSAQEQGDRLLNKDGSYNVTRRGQNFLAGYSAYHFLITIKWWRFNLIILFSFIFLNAFFAMLYALVGFDQIQGLNEPTFWGKYLECFAFSAQTLTTVGYGTISPIGFGAMFISTFEALAGLMSFALLTGLLYGRFSRPHVKMIYSKHALIAPYQDGNALMFRIANSRRNQLIECEANVMFSYLEKETNIRRFVNLKLELNKITGLPLSWTIVHPIDANSPINEITAEEFLDINAEFILLFKAFDDTYSQQVYTRHSYTAQELIWNAKFKPMFHRSDDGHQTVLELEMISAFEMAK